jgi:DNA-binding MarR family transcriptional regulator
MPRVEVLTEALERNDFEAAPVRSVSRATARRASHRRATARGHQSDNDASIMSFLAHHPGSTVGDLARGLNVNPGTVSIHLNQLANSGEINKVTHGYNTKQATRPRSLVLPSTPRSN